MWMTKPRCRLEERRKYRKVLILALGTWLAVALFSPVQADTSASADLVNDQKYGNCSVVTAVDMLTDEEDHVFICLEVTLTDSTSLSIRSEQGSLVVLVSKGSVLHFDQNIYVAIRVDKGPVIERTGLWLSGANTAFIQDHGLAASLMDDLAQGQRVVVQVGLERGNIRLEGAADAIADFRKRIGS